jgi:hypothetical protein
MFDMTIAAEIKRLQALIKSMKSFVHEPRDGRPVPLGVARSWQVQLTSAKRNLKEWEKLSRERKKVQNK